MSISSNSIQNDNLGIKDETDTDKWSSASLLTRAVKLIFYVILRNSGAQNTQEWQKIT